MIAHSNGTAVTDSRRLLLMDDDDRTLRGLAAAVCDKYHWRLTVAEERWETLLPPERQRPKFVVLGFSLDDDNALDFLWDLQALCPQAPVGIVTSDAANDVADVVGLAGGTAVVVKPCDTADVAAALRPELDRTQR